MRKDEALMQFERVLKLRRLSPNTIKMYMYYVSLFLNSTNKADVLDCDLNDAQSFVAELIDVHSYRPLSANVAICAVNYFFDSVLNIFFSRRQFPFLKYPEFNPFLFSKDQIVRLLDTGDVRLRLIILLGFDCGLWVSEVASLRVADIDSKKMLIRIPCSKRGKSRNVKLSDACLTALRKYWLLYRPDYWMFPGRNADVHVTADTVRYWFNKYVSKFDFYTSEIHFHCLRHTFATCMLDNGCDIFLLKDLLGHSSLISTARYVHLSTRAVQQASSLSDAWGIQ